ncbi:MAG: DUF1015 domain-containing protein [Actinobacteria bacterium]|nr:DUF1015 domain-containing protein [Actinomycetota bacterium]
MAAVEPFRAVRYDEGRAGPLASLVAPPYDVISPEDRAGYLARSEHNVVHLTLPESEEQARRAFRDWLRDGVLVREHEPSYWALRQDYVGPDGVARARTGLVAAVRVEPYERRVVLPHERTHRGPKEGRLRLLRAVRAQLEPILLLYEGIPPFEIPSGGPDLETNGAALWRLDADPAIERAFAEQQLLIADGHHRYETAVAFHEEEGTPEGGFVLAVLVSTRDPGLMIFPTHRVFRTRPSPTFAELRRDPKPDPETALRELAELSRDHAAVVVHERGRTTIAVDGAGLDVELVDRLGHEGITYTPDWEEAVRAVEAGESAVAFLLRPTRIEDVFAVAKRGETMPQKSTYFYPKLLSGLLFQAV